MLLSAVATDGLEPGASHHEVAPPGASPACSDIRGRPSLRTQHHFRKRPNRWRAATVAWVHANYRGSQRTLEDETMRRLALVVVGLFIACAIVASVGPEVEANPCERDPTICQ